MKSLSRLFKSTQPSPATGNSIVKPHLGGHLELLESRTFFSVSPAAVVNPYVALDPSKATYKKGVAPVTGGYGVFDSGDYLRYDNVDFGSGSGARSALVTLALAPGQEGGRIDLRTGDVATGPRIGAIFAQPTGSFTTYITERIYVSGAAGLKNVFIVARDKANVANIKSVQFSKTKITRIMPLGDSITNGYGGYDNYRYFLNKSLIGSGYNVDFVGQQMKHADGEYPPHFDYDQEHEGYAGYSSAQILSLAYNAARVDKPDIVLLHIGTNDLTSGTPASTTGSNISSIIDALRSANANVKIILAKILPRAGYDSAVASLNAEIATVAANKNVTLVDMNTGISSNTNYLFDGIHPKNNVATTMADRWKAAIVGLI